MIKRLRKYRKSMLLLLTLAALSCYDGLQVTHYHIETEKLTDNMTIALITDLHGTVYGKNQRELIDAIRDESPDIIMLGGDIYDHRGAQNAARTLLAALPEIAPTYYVSGNHEWWSENPQQIFAEIEMLGITVLADEYVRVGGVIIAGVDDPAKGYNQYIADRFDDMFTPYSGYEQEPSLKEAFGDLAEESAYKILLAHRPERLSLYAEYGFDLVLSGHAHGGQVRVPYILNGLYSPNQGVFPQNAGGVYESGDTTLVVSRGLSRVHSARVRVFNRPELVFVRLNC
ncbi:MAG: metallophosphoesterase [Oscillospiraceae bacterium]|nr:metallophosphoesterase [Oscillospiraceae bacterium]